MRATATAAFVAPDVFIEGPDGAVFDRPSVKLEPGARVADLTVKGSGLDAAHLAGQPLRLTLVDGDRSLETDLDGAAPRATSRSAAPNRRSSPSLPWRFSVA